MVKITIHPSAVLPKAQLGMLLCIY